MPVVRIALSTSVPAASRDIGACVYTAMRETIGIPEGDNFQIITRHGPDELIFNPTFYGIDRTDGFMIIEITLAKGRQDEVKQALFARITSLLEDKCDVRPADVMITLHEAGLADMSLGLGRAQFVEDLPPHLQNLSTADTRS
ncbi:phenylpyruvate tautomerase PptA (4-oxalocrotonate tautomerase family) [Rhodococcus erythropolis]|uniref:tautomerase family protein n=1 Tax=Rhodococcus erythropolis TaxID=1833 RepID=UPI002167CD27|nr:tautomerase family protein [Rhodococcus erythropolis]MCS4255693.1 phenylpyruvate tautomerase PptA (4-oxalocrotonate tautomerase family) [Rhodococcus erythropolis]MCW2425206.1 phenylpyruvate tautomerase PptA (4-oxalocrotonate tautomerase family) [Rhodococcus erythropolis]